MICIGRNAASADGILILDDLYQERWPAVAAGTFRFMNDPANQLRPFAISPNDDLLLQGSGVRRPLPGSSVLRFCNQILGTPFIFGSEVLIFGRRTLSNRIRNHPLVRDNPNLYHRFSQLRHLWR